MRSRADARPALPTAAWLLLLLIVPLHGCGQKGALYIPGPDGKPLRSPSAAAASAPFTAAAPALPGNAAPTTATSKPAP